MKDETRRQRLKALAETGNLRGALSRASVDDDVTDLIVDLALRYCERKRKSRKETS